MNEFVRLRKFLVELDDYFNMFSYYDEETDETVIDGDEQQCYDILMRNDEFHLLGADVVKKWIHMAFTDWELFMRMCHTLKALA